MPLSSSFLVVIHTSKIKYRIDCLSAKWLQSFCCFTAAYPRYPREAKVTLTITGAPRKGNDSDEGARRGEQGAGRGWPPTATYKFQEWSPPGVKTVLYASRDGQHLCEPPIRSDYLGFTPLL